MTKLSNTERRRAILAVLSGESMYKVGPEYGITRQALHEHVREALRDPEEALREAEDEVAFRRRVLKAKPGEEK